MFRQLNDTFAAWIFRGCAIIAGAIVLFILMFLVSESLPALRRIHPLRFFTDNSWHPSGSAENGEFNLLPMLAGTLLITAGAIVVAAPLGVASALFCHFYAPQMIARLYRKMIELLAGIPSVVYGLWGLVTLVPLVGYLHPPGPSLLAGIIILSIMILPTIALMSDAAIASVPPEYLHGAAALGLSRWGTIRGVVFPVAKPGILTSIILGTGRAIGETMAVLMVCGNVVQIPQTVFDPMRTLTANIALEMAYAMGDHRSALFVSGLVLMGMIVLLVATAEFISKAPTEVRCQ